MLTVGVDEVGRGSWAGPLVAGAVILSNNVPGLKDSKQLSRIQRLKLSKLIFLSGVVGLGWVSAKEIDSLGLTQSTRLAMHRAVAQISCSFDRLIVDGNINHFAEDPRSNAIIKADTFIPEVSAASIVAKVARDDYMVNQSKKFPAYNFEKHVGYGTVLHKAKLVEHGPCQLHRLSYRPVMSAGVISPAIF